MSDAATVPKALLIEAAEEVQRMVDEIRFLYSRDGEDWDTESYRVFHERLSNLAERLRAAADQGDKAEIWRG